MSTDSVRQYQFTERIAFEMTRRERVLWIVLGIAFVGDVATTALGLHIGLHEANPIARGAIYQWGMIGLIGLKLVPIAIALVIRPLVEHGARFIIPLALSLPWLFATANNLVIIVSVS